MTAAAPADASVTGPGPAKARPPRRPGRTSWPAAALTASLAAAVPAGTADALMIDTWQTEQGLPQNHITAITQTRDGYLWLGTYEGLARFDGVRFVVHHSARDDALPSSRITSLHEDRHGTLWIGHEHGQLSRLVHGRFAAVDTTTVSPRGSIVALQSDAADDLWLLRRNGTAERLRDRFALPAPEATTVPMLCRQSDLPATPSSSATSSKAAPPAPNLPLWRAHAGRLTALAGPDAPAPPAFPRTNDYVIHLCAGRDGRFWVLTGDRLWRWRPGDAASEVERRPWNDTPVSRMLEDRAGRLWIGTQERGLYCRHPDGEYRHFSRTNGLASDWIRSLLEDREGTLWVGTGGGGLCALRERRVHMLAAPDDWLGRGLLSLSPGRADDLWVGTEGAGLYHLSDGRFERFGPAQGLANAYVWTVLDDGQSPPWAGTWGRGLFQLNPGGTWTPVPGLSHDGFVVTALSRSPGGPLWVGTHRGLARVGADGIEWIGRELTSPEVRCLAEARDGSLWFGMSGGGLARWRAGQLTQFRQPDGLPSNDVWSLLATETGSLWIGTVGGGLCRWRDNRFVTIGQSAGLPNNVICQIIDDGQGALWLGTRGGIVRASRQELEDCADGRLARPAFFTLGKSDGLATLECSGGSQPSYARTPDGRLWFPTTRGLAVIQPSALRTNTLPPPVLIESFQAGTNLWPEPFDGTVRPTVPPGRVRCQIRFTAPSFIAPETIRFRYRLEGLDEDWTETTGPRVANYNPMPPGHYTFRVTACNRDGVWNPDGAALAFTVQPHFWQSWWLQSGAVLGGALGIGVAVRRITRRRYRRRLEQVERQRAIERERSRIARDIHDDLGASLTRITLLSQTASEDLSNPELAAIHLHRIEATARDLTKALEEIVWAINPKHDTLDSLANYLGRFAQDFTTAAGLRCRIDIPTHLPPWPLTAETRHNLFLAFKEALHNTVRHAAARQVNIVLQLQPGGFILAVEDDGCGFDPQAVARPRPGDSRGNGLANLTRRLEEIGGRCELQSQPGAGTIVRLVVKTHDSPSPPGPRMLPS